MSSLLGTPLDPHRLSHPHQQIMSKAVGYHDQLCWLPLIPDNYLTGPLVCVKTGEISLWSRDNSSNAIVSPGNEQMLGGGRAYEDIHNVAGPELRNAILSIPEVQPGIRCLFGEAKITPGYKLSAAHVIHTVGPICGSDSYPAESLSTAYRSCLSLAKEKNIQYVAFPDMSCGASSYPAEEAATIAFSVVKEFASDFKQVHFLFTSDEVYNVWFNKGMQTFCGWPAGSNRW